MMLSNALMILNENRFQDHKLVQEIFQIKMLDALMNQYMLSLGEFDLENFGLDRKDPVVWVLFLLSTFISQILFLNMLIAVMADTFEKQRELQSQSALNEKVKLLADYAVAVPRFNHAEKQATRFIYQIKPVLGENELESWEGTVTQLKRYIDLVIIRLLKNNDDHVTRITGKVKTSKDSL